MNKDLPLDFFSPVEYLDEHGISTCIVGDAALSCYRHNEVCICSLIVAVADSQLDAATSLLYSFGCRNKLLEFDLSLTTKSISNAPNTWSQLALPLGLVKIVLCPASDWRLDISPVPTYEVFAISGKRVGSILPFPAIYLQG
jgi:hypothetical protein